MAPTRFLTDSSCFILGCVQKWEIPQILLHEYILIGKIQQNSLRSVFYFAKVAGVRPSCCKEAQLQCGVLAAEGSLDLQTHWEEDLGHFGAGVPRGACPGVPRGRGVHSPLSTWLWQEWSVLPHQGSPIYNNFWAEKEDEGELSELIHHYIVVLW